MVTPSLSLILSILFLKSSYSLVFELSKVYDPPLNNQSLVFESLFSNIISINSCIGTPPQCFDLSLDMSSYPYWVMSSEAKHKPANKGGYRTNNSSTYSLKSNYLLKFNYDKYDKAYSALETLTVDSKTVNNFNFLLSIEFSDTPASSGNIGLDIQNRIYLDTPDTNFINQLKQNGVIDSYDFAIKYSAEPQDSIVGELIIGKQPHEMDKALSEDDLISVRPLVSGENLIWGINLDQAKYGGAIIENASTAVIKIEIGVIIGSASYFNYIRTTFFDAFITKKECWLVQFLKRLQGFVCKKDIDTSSFELLSLRRGSTVFSFNALDLFKEELEQKVFMVVFGNKNFYSESADWTLGEPFLKKYLFVFNQDKKTMKFYRHKDEQQSGGNERWSFFKIFLFTTGIVIGIGILLLIWRAIQRKRVPQQKATINGLLSKDI